MKNRYKRVLGIVLGSRLEVREYVTETPKVLVYTLRLAGGRFLVGYDYEQTDELRLSDHILRKLRLSENFMEKIVRKFKKTL